MIYKGLTLSLHSEVYEPAEDSFQLLDVVKICKGDKVFEIGTGCGIIALECCRRGAEVVCSDVNPFAVELALQNYHANKTLMKGSFEIRKGDLFNVLNKDESFDVIIFNPPYLPTKPEDLVGGSGWFDKTVDGGLDGLKETKRFIEGIHKYLEKNGTAYFIFSSLSDRAKLEGYIDKARFSYRVMLSRLYDDEYIDVYSISLK